MKERVKRGKEERDGGKKGKKGRKERGTIHGLYKSIEYLVISYYLRFCLLDFTITVLSFIYSITTPSPH